ncbi:hypothetical protein MMC26_001506 [Xylographa opegraphella]|nr:hypothetical protein [Xylographa opegraphella]
MSSYPPRDPSQTSPLPAPSRLLTTHNSDALAVFHPSSGPTPWQVTAPHIAMNLVYTTTTPTPSFTHDTDLHAHAALDSATAPLVVRHGSTCRIVDIGPLSVSTNHGTGQEAEPLMHRTQSLDYGIVVSGEVDLTLDGGETRTMRPGDVVVQRGTMHAWRNKSETEWCRMVFVLIGSEEVVVGGRVLPEDLSGGKKAEGT